MNPKALEHPFVQNESRALYALESMVCDNANLGKIKQIKNSLETIFNAPEYADEWKEVERNTAQLALLDGNGSVNPGDRRALYYLARALRPLSILEIGTHLGGSTVHLALAQQNSRVGELVTVDAKDVNDIKEQPWRKFGSSFAPREMLAKVGCNHRVRFVTETSTAFFSTQAGKYDLIFLDGNHSASVVYQDIADSLGHLRKGGYIILHDYFPNLEPLWSDGSVIPGPALSVERLIREDLSFDVQPLGALPWSTKLDSNVTSLALFGRR
jgi:predicted O-methyltransferase YrrM